MSQVVTLSHSGLPSTPARTLPAEVWGLAIAWSAEEPARVGEVALLSPEEEAWVLGRDPSSGEADATGRAEPVRFLRQRPVGHPLQQAAAVISTVVRGDWISRRQLLLHPRPEGLLIKNIGRCPAWLNGKPLVEGMLVDGDTLHLQDQLLLLCVRRPRELPALRFYPTERLQSFGESDQDGILGESPAIWKMRDRIAGYARTPHHVLIIGDSGSGKELAAQALHRLSERGARRLIADNAAAIPPGLATALLFGNRRNFPNPGMEERIGLVGSAHGSTLFLDEIGDMPKEVQPMFLRVAERGEYTRLGDEGRVQHADFRLIGATNRPELLRYELKRRFAREIRVPGLEQRREDIPLLLRHLLIQLAGEGDMEAGAYVRGGQPRVSPYFIEALLHHRYQTHVSELKRLLVLAMAESDGGEIRGTGLSGIRSMMGPKPTVENPVIARPRRVLPAKDEAQRCLDRLGGNVRQAADELGISRDQLNRMIRREQLQLHRRTRLSEDGEMN